MIESGHITEVVEREVSPFAAVIESYKKHARKTAARTRPQQTIRQFRKREVKLITLNPRVAAVIYYVGTVQQLERIDAQA